jgi:hypothetical protein
VVKPKSPAADVVSIAIAKQMANSARNGISERQLQYGSMKEPIVEERSDEKKPSHIPEESFYSTNGNVLEIQPYIFNKNGETSEEESSEEKKPVKDEPFNPAQLGFEDIGYKAYEPSRPQYTIVQNNAKVSHDCPSRQRKCHHKRPCDCAKNLVVDRSSISSSLNYDSSDSNQSYSY